ncbi:hypothetical protein [Chroococcidiopsis sp. CCNUC1]|jgi:hypothetical protein|uniref:hypothetical protein n=1 Tax=Chroococcidiopsis sp. CCNUC1 TaxID=2653189 RepID=UPI000D04E9C5|nr:hypothetical protein [Chroococcidiopsis sp. CCNUC1]PSB47518.1 hypothetical protein C7B80_09295 [Cyanosarcina cf. burmensis CCALA 770]URD50869.1 hypothetical protein M5J74_02515 [Chroococcidiopsis sp. CCNUC1]
MPSPEETNEIVSGGSLNLSSAIEKLVTTGSLNLSSPEEVEFERRNREKDKDLEREQKRISFWIKDTAVFVVALIIILLIDFYAFTVLQKRYRF